MNNYRFEFSEPALKDVKRLDSVNKKRILAKLRFFISQDEPLHLAKALKGESGGEYRWRVGNYRIIFDVNGETLTILRVQHRREVYRR